MNLNSIEKKATSSGENPHISEIKKITHDTKSFDYWLKKNNYYHQQTIGLYTFLIPHHSRVLHINCRNGYMLQALNPLHGAGVDVDAQSIAQAQKRYPTFRFYHGLDAVEDQIFDYIILSYATMEMYDIQTMFQELKRFCSTHTRIIIDTYSYMWEPLLTFLQKIGLRRPTEFKNWVSIADLETFMHLSGYEVITKGHYMLLPAYIPLISTFCNKVLIHIPGLRTLSLSRWIIARPALQMHKQDVKVSIIIPCKNEKGNIEVAVKRCPAMGSLTEIIFVEGNSSDGTLQEIKRVSAIYPEKNISWYVQDGKGKGDAVRKGFAKATGDILMILDADLTVPPEELPKFYHALITNKGELINGSRLVYGMESQAMRFLNVLANFFFSTLFSWLLDQKIKDTLCGTKVLWASDYKKIEANRHVFGNFDPFGDFDLLFGAAKLHLKIVDMPIHYKNRMYGQTQIRRFWHGWILLGMSFVGIKKFKWR